MKKTTLRSIAAIALASLGLLCAGTAAAADATTNKYSNISLEELHKGKKVTCVGCHEEKQQDKIAVDDNETVVNATCVECHGTLGELAASAKGHITPHRSHLGTISCTSCHSGHSESKVYCNNCHTFDMSIPGGKAPVKKVERLAINARGVEKTDVLVIGAGAAGFTAAITAHDGGAKVILVEKQPITGGNSALSAGGMNATETVFQKKKGIKDSVDVMISDTMKGGGNANDAELVKILATKSASSVDWLTSIGADISDIGQMAGATNYRTHRPTGGAAVGSHITNVLKKNAADRKLDVRVNSKVLKLVEDGSGRVIGAVIEGKHSGTYTILAKAVVMTAGGFSANQGMIAQYQPQYVGMTTSNQPGATGDGMLIGEQAGGQLIDMKEIQIHPTVAAGSRILITEAVRGNGAILINRDGKRFVNELTTRDKASQATLAQPGGSAYLVFDSVIHKSLKQIDGYFELGLVKEGDSVEALAKAIGAPADVLARSIDTYNKSFDAKKDSEFGRPDMPRAIRTPKFYAIEVKPGIHYTMGGLKINRDTQVIGKDGKIVPGLLAAGEVTGGVHGKNRLGGNSISETITFGRIAGANALKMVKDSK